MPCEDGSRDWVCAATAEECQGLPAATRSQDQPRTGLPCASRGAWPYPHLHRRLLTPELRGNALLFYAAQLWSFIVGAQEDQPPGGFRVRVSCYLRNTQRARFGWVLRLLTFRGDALFPSASLVQPQVPDCGACSEDSRGAGVCQGSQSGWLGRQGPERGGWSVAAPHPSSRALDPQVRGRRWDSRTLDRVQQRLGRQLGGLRKPSQGARRPGPRSTRT